MTTARAALMPSVDLLRGLLDTVMGLRQYTIFVRVTTWSGGLPGAAGALASVVDTPVVVAGGARPKVEQLAQRDVVASGGTFQDLDLRVGPLTPASAEYPAGVDPSLFDPPVAGANTEILFNVTGPGLAGGAWFKKIGQEVIRNFGSFIILRKTGEQDG